MRTLEVPSALPGLSRRQPLAESSVEEAPAEAAQERVGAWPDVAGRPSVRGEEWMSADSDERHSAPDSDFLSVPGSEERPISTGCGDVSPCLLGRLHLSRANSKVSEHFASELPDDKAAPSPHTYEATPEHMHEISWADLRARGSFGEAFSSGEMGAPASRPGTPSGPGEAQAPTGVEEVGNWGRDAASAAASGPSSEHGLVTVARPTAGTGSAAHEAAHQQQLVAVFLPAGAAAFAPQGQWYAIPSVPVVRSSSSTDAAPGARGCPAPLPLQTAQSSGPQRRQAETAARPAAAKPNAPLAPGLVTAQSRAADAEGMGRAVGASCRSCAPEDRTTVMLRNIPNDIHRDRFLKLLDNEGLAGQYDFVYLPADFRTGASLGYAFVNMVSPRAVQRLWRAFDGFIRWNLPSRKRCSVSWSEPHQGFEANMQRYRDSPVMHPSVPDVCKPIVFKDGVRIPYPEPLKPLRAPRVRKMA